MREKLEILARDLRWIDDELWRSVDAELWEETRNPWLLFQRFEGEIDVTRCWERREAYLRAPTWFPDSQLTIAYFSMEFGLSEALPIYSGGLGILAGDHLKACSDLGVPLVGIGLLYGQGYFRQTFDSSGAQCEFYPYNEPGQLPVQRLDVHLPLPMPGRTLWLRVWEVCVGRVRLLLLDTNDPLNTPADRGITAELYGGGQSMRLLQEIVLGIGGWRLLRHLGIEPTVCHLNEGHAALAILERAHSQGGDFHAALEKTRRQNLFTTHTPVAAGFDRFPKPLVEEHLGDYADELGIGVNGLLNDGEMLNMAFLAAHGSGAVNGVSRLHGQVSTDLLKMDVGYVTNGVHIPSWESPAADQLWACHCGEERWRSDLATLEEDFRKLTDEQLKEFRQKARERLIEYLGGTFDPNKLTLGFARRFASYKRVTLLLKDPDRFLRLLDKVQLVLAGKAHPADDEGKKLVEEWNAFAKRPEVEGRIIFLPDYDMQIAQRLTHGVDLWINTPLRPWEASGTSGMKVLVNGGLNLSVLDGWWAEAYEPDVGWAIEGDDLYDVLEQQVLPSFYGGDWLQRVRESMARLTPRFSTNRMVREYCEKYYLPMGREC